MYCHFLVCTEVSHSALLPLVTMHYSTVLYIVVQGVKWLCRNESSLRPRVFIARSLQPAGNSTCLGFVDDIMGSFSAALGGELATLRASLRGATLLFAKADLVLKKVLRDPEHNGFLPTLDACCGMGTFNGEGPCGLGPYTICPQVRWSGWVAPRWCSEEEEEKCWGAVCAQKTGLVKCTVLKQYVVWYIVLYCTRAVLSGGPRAESLVLFASSNM